MRQAQNGLRHVWLCRGLKLVAGMQREARLRRRQDFDAVHRYGRSSANGLLVLRARANSLPQSRFGFSISKRVGNAVVRNRLKRRLRMVALALPVRGGWDMVIIARPPAAAAAYWDLLQSLRSLCLRARLLRAEGPSEGNRPVGDGV